MSPPLVDVHAHFLTDRYVAEAKNAGHTHPDGMPSWPTWTAREHLELMDQVGIGTALLSISSPGVHFGDDKAARNLARHVNDTGADIVREHPTRFGLFASLPLPDIDGALAELAYALDELGSEGITVKTNTHGVYLADPRHDPLWAELNRRHTVVFVHPTSPPHAETISLGRPRPVLEFLFDSTRAASDLVLDGVLTRYPDIRWVFTHGGGTLPLVADRIQLFSTFLMPSDNQPGVVDQLRALWFDMAGTPFPRQMPALVSAFGSERILYGSDYCWTPARGAAAQVASIDAAPPLDGVSWRQLTTANAARLLSPSTN